MTCALIYGGLVDSEQAAKNRQHRIHRQAVQRHRFNNRVLADDTFIGD